MSLFPMPRGVKRGQIKDPACLSGQGIIADFIRNLVQGEILEWILKTSLTLNALKRYGHDLNRQA